MRLLSTTLTAAVLLLVPVCAMAGTVIASTYAPGDGIVPRNDYQTSSGRRYDPEAMTCAHHNLPFGSKLYLRHGNNAAEITITDRGPWLKGRELDCSIAVGKALHLGGLGSVHVEPFPPLPRSRPKEAPQ